MPILPIDKSLAELLEAVDLPRSGYETAGRRYKDLAEWLNRPEALCSRYSPHIYPQGSFRLGTVVRPISDDGEYDLDLGCRLRTGISKATHSQRDLKTLVGRDLESYRAARGIKKRLEEKRRCWRLEYADDLRFHMDAVPSIPETGYERQIRESVMVRVGVEPALARSVAALSGAITDNRLPHFAVISTDWRTSNSEGYALWFESRARQARAAMEGRALAENVKSIDELPAFRWRSPLQRAIQVLKRHRDVMFADNQESQPISIVITTLAAIAYRGEESIEDALRRILSTMASFIAERPPRIPNPVNPEEDFADRWDDPAYRHLDLEKNFRLWLQQAQRDLSALERQIEEPAARRILREQFRVTRSPSMAAGPTSVAGSLLRAPASPSGLEFPDKPVVPKKPAGFALGPR